MNESRPVEARIGDTKLYVATSDIDGGGMGDVGLSDYADFTEVFAALGALSDGIRERLVDMRPDTTTVEVSIGFAASSGKIFALLGQAEGSGSIKVTMQWSAREDSADEG